MTQGAPGPTRHEAALRAGVAMVALLPFVRGLLQGQAFFFRDLAGHFFPLRVFAASGLREGHARYWNPFTHEGVPLALPPVGYPLDLLQVLWASEAGISALLALHVPLAALGMFALARRLGIDAVGASGAALAYALGGFTLSSLNLYVYLQAIAWAPFVILGLLRAASGTGQDVARASVPVAVALSTTGLEIVAQTLLAGVLLAWPRDRRAVARLSLALLLGLGLAGAVVLPMAALVEGTARGHGFATDVVLGHSVHPITLLQTVLLGLYADPGRLTDTFWGQNFFPRGFPYFLSLYLGVLTLGLALRGARQGTRTARVLVGLGVLGLVISLGAYAGLAPVVDTLAFLRRFRFPSKAFFLVQLSIALLLGLALHSLQGQRDTGAWRRTGVLLVALGGSLALLPWLALHASGPRRFLLAGFFPSEMAWPAREAAAGAILRDAQTGALFAVLAGLVAFAVARGRVSTGRAAPLVVAMLAADLLRAGAGLNPMVSPSFYRPSPEALELARQVRSAGGRLFTVDAGYSPAYYAARATRPDHEVWSFAVLRETLVPGFNLALAVPTALSLDQTMLVPASRVLAPEDAAPAALPRVIGRLRAAAVSHVVAVEPLSHPDLEPLALPSAESLAPLRSHVYRLLGSLPWAEVQGPGVVAGLLARPGRLRFSVTAEPGAVLLVREAWAPGWEAFVDGVPAAIDRRQAPYCAVPVPSGAHRVDLVYTPPGLRPGLALTLVSAAVAVWLRLRPRRV